ncbi:hypothetical protein niasHT_007646 [Heterodera trifolii]|uniref:SWI/SNF complex subunit SMARCC2 n=1 Tax=Heterodera trifolii TaxID=157864 RepID=A0ABD2LPS1_9BILA
MPPKGFKRKREEGSEVAESVDLDRIDDDENSRLTLTPSAIIKTKDKDIEIGNSKQQKLTELDDDGPATNQLDPTQTNLSSTVEPQTHYIIVPSYSAWFDYNAIHQIEKQAHPDFFNGRNKSKTPETYIAYRNFMIDTYRLNPFEFLSVTSCRRNLSGDVCSIIRIHEFLQKWGLINYQVESESRPAPLTVPPTSHFMVMADTPFGLQPLHSLSNAEKPSQRVYPHPAVSQPPQDNDKDQQQSEQQQKEEQKQQQPNEREKSADQREMKATNDRKMIHQPGLKLDQYRKQLAAMKTKGAAPTRDWSPQETLLLLEGLEMFKDDWNQVADHVGTRTQDECILHFLQLPIQDPFLEENDVLGPLAYQPVPFSQSGNPVMSTVAFLASVVDPRIASAAAKAALEEFGKMRDDIPPLLEKAHRKNIESHAKETEELDGELGLSAIGTFTKSEESQKSEQKNTRETAKLENGEISQTEAAKNQQEEKMDTDEQQHENTEEGGGAEKDKEETIVREAKEMTTEAIQVAAATALGAAATKAKYLVGVEEKRMKALVAQLVEAQMKKFELKLKHFEELEQLMDRERETLEAQRQQLIAERQAFHLDQLRYLEQRARSDAQHQLTNDGRMPTILPPGFEVSNPTQPQAVVAPAGIPPSQSAAKAQPPPSVQAAQQPLPPVSVPPQQTQPVPPPASDDSATVVPPSMGSVAAPPQPPLTLATNTAAEVSTVAATSSSPNTAPIAAAPPAPSPHATASSTAAPYAPQQPPTSAPPSIPPPQQQQMPPPPAQGQQPQYSQPPLSTAYYPPPSAYPPPVHNQSYAPPPHNATAAYPPPQAFPPQAAPPPQHYYGSVSRAAQPPAQYGQSPQAVGPPGRPIANYPPQYDYYAGSAGQPPPQHRYSQQPPYASYGPPPTSAPQQQPQHYPTPGQSQYYAPPSHTQHSLQGQPPPTQPMGLPPSAGPQQQQQPQEMIVSAGSVHHHQQQQHHQGPTGGIVQTAADATSATPPMHQESNKEC